MSVDLILDTNILIMADGNQSSQASIDCQLACIALIESVKNGDARLVLDNQDFVLNEYKQNFRASGQINGEFLIWLLSSIYDQRFFALIESPSNVNVLDHFPSTDDFGAFDPSDRKWIALACAYAEQNDGYIAEIMQAADSKWCNFCKAFVDHGILCTFLCGLCAEQALCD